MTSNQTSALVLFYNQFDYKINFISFYQYFLHQIVDKLENRE